MIEAGPACLGYVFSDMRATVEYCTHIFLADADGVVPCFGIRLEKLFKNFSR